MTISVGDRLPDAQLLRIGDDGPEAVSLRALTEGRRVAIFGVPGAFTPTCSSAHMPSFVRTADDFREKGVEEIVCIAVNDPHVLKAWSEQTGADAAGIKVLGDSDGAFTAAIGMAFDAPPAGFHGRSKRYSMLVEDGTVVAFNPESSRSSCEISGGEALLETA